MSLQRRLEVLEGRVETPEEDRSEIRQQMRESLDRIAALRRSDSPEDRAELEAIRKALGRRLARHRGEGGR